MTPFLRNWNQSSGAGKSIGRGHLLVSLLCPDPLHPSDILLVLQDAKFAVVLEEDLDISVDFFR